MTDLRFRTIIINKSQLRHIDFSQTHDVFYNKMYFQLLHKKIDSDAFYNIYIDRKDTHSNEKAQSLKSYLERDYNYIRILQAILSYASA